MIHLGNLILKQEVKMKKVAFIFPGQGSQTIGMGRDFFENSDTAKEMIKKASERLNIDFEKLLFEENENLGKTEFTQPAILLVSSIALAVFKEKVATSETCHQPAQHDKNHLTIDRAQELGGLMSLSAPQRGKGKLIDHVSQKLGMKNIRSADKNQKWNTDRQRLSGQRQRIEEQRGQQCVAHLFSI